jgi:hypothetical protein
MTKQITAVRFVKCRSLRVVGAYIWMPFTSSRCTVTAGEVPRTTSPAANLTLGHSAGDGGSIASPTPSHPAAGSLDGQLCTKASIEIDILGIGASLRHTDLVMKASHIAAT